MKVLIIGILGGTHIGECFKKAAFELGLSVRFINSRLAMKAPLWLNRVNWWLLGKRPTRLKRFTKDVLEVCRQWHPDYLIATGKAPFTVNALREMSSLGIYKINYLTDDPWNPAHRASWFIKTLPLYEYIFSPRKANIEDLHKLGCKKVSYLPFAYAPELHFSELPSISKRQSRFDYDVVFVGGADSYRIPYIATLIQAGFKVALYGSYWDRFPQTRPYTHGQSDPQTLRKATSSAKVALCLVRKANRDGHCMRTFEIPAIGGCMLTEDTEEHRAIFGDDGKAVVYFRIISEMIAKLQWLLEHKDERERLAKTAHDIIVNGRNTYKDRLTTMLGIKP